MMDKDIIRLKFRVTALMVLVVSLLLAIALDMLSIDATTFISVFQASIVPLSGLIVADYATKPTK